MRGGPPGRVGVQALGVRECGCADVCSLVSGVVGVEWCGYPHTIEERACITMSMRILSERSIYIFFQTKIV
jgi:hypothetical protein